MKLKIWKDGMGQTIVSLNDFRIAGPKPIGPGIMIHEAEVQDKHILRAMYRKVSETDYGFGGSFP